MGISPKETYMEINFKEYREMFLATKEGGRISRSIRRRKFNKYRDNFEKRLSSYYGEDWYRVLFSILRTIEALPDEYIYGANFWSFKSSEDSPLQEVVSDNPERVKEILTFMKLTKIAGLEIDLDQWWRVYIIIH